jgi:hypothetical protein
VRWHTESPLIKCHKGHHVSLHQHGGHGILGHVTGHELCPRHEPLAHEGLQMVLHDLGRSSVLFRHGLRGEKKKHSLSPKNLLSLSLPLSLSLSRRKEGGEETMTHCAGGCRDAQWQPFVFIAPQCHNRGGKAMGPYNTQ